MIIYLKLEEQGPLTAKDNELEISHLKSIDESNQPSHDTHDVQDSHNELDKAKLDCEDEGIDMDEPQNLATHEVQVIFIKCNQFKNPVLPFINT